LERKNEGEEARWRGSGWEGFITAKPKTLSDKGLHRWPKFQSFETSFFSLVILLLPFLSPNPPTSNSVLS